MENRNLQNAAPQPLKLVSYFGYASGDAGCNLSFAMFGMFLLLYYTDVAGLNAAAVGTLFLLVRIWDAFADVFAGRLVDMTTTRWGKFRPLVLFGSVPLLLLSMATFSVPGGWSGGAKLGYAYVTYALVGLAYSIVNIPYGSMAPALTQVPKERARLAAFRTMGASGTGLMLAWLVTPQIKRHVGDPAAFQHSLTIMTGVFVVAGFLLFLFTFLTCKENVHREVPTVSLKQSLQTFRTNKPLLMLCTTALAAITGSTASGTAGAYYARDILLNPDAFIWMTVVNTCIIFMVAPMVPFVVSRIGKRRGYITGSVIAIFGACGIALAPNAWVAIAASAVMGVGGTIFSTLMWALEADTVEYGEWKTGVRTEGTTYALFSFTRKVGQAFGGAAAAFILSWGGYSAAHAGHQPDHAQLAIRISCGLLPALFYIVAIVVMFFYPLTEVKFHEMMGEMAARRAAKRAGTKEEVPAA